MVVVVVRYNLMVFVLKEVVIKKMIDLEEEEKDFFLKEVKLFLFLKYLNIVWNVYFFISYNVGVYVFWFFFVDRYYKVYLLKEFLFEFFGGDFN